MGVVDVNGRSCLFFAPRVKQPRKIHNSSVVKERKVQGGMFVVHKVVGELFCNVQGYKV